MLGHQAPVLFVQRHSWDGSSVRAPEIASCSGRSRSGDSVSSFGSCMTLRPSTMGPCSMLSSSRWVVSDGPAQSTVDAGFSPEVPSPGAADVGNCPSSNPLTHLGGRPGPVRQGLYQNNPTGRSCEQGTTLGLWTWSLPSWGHTP